MSASPAEAEAAASAPGDPEAQRRDVRLGMAAALSAYLCWGLIVIFFKWLGDIPVWEIVGHRISWTVVFVGLFLALRGRLGEVKAALSDWRVLRALIICATLIGANWTIYIWAIDTGEVLQASFGYFINPLMNVALGFVLLGERLSRWQGIAVGLATLSVAIQAMLLPGFPWISLALAGSFAIYGYIRKLTPVGASPGLFVEATVLLPPALGFIIYLQVTGAGHFGDDPLTVVQLMLTGVLTALPLILFAIGARRLRLATIGLVQYLAPSIQFLLAVFVYGEPLSSARLATFVLIWISLAIYTADSVRHRPQPMAV